MTSLGHFEVNVGSFLFYHYIILKSLFLQTTVNNDNHMISSRDIITWFCIEHWNYKLLLSTSKIRLKFSFWFKINWWQQKGGENRNESITESTYRIAKIHFTANSTKESSLARFEPPCGQRWNSKSPKITSINTK